MYFVGRPISERARRKETEAQATADWNALGRAAAALEMMRREGMDENTVRLAEKRLFMDPNSKASQAWRRVTKLSPIDAFEVDTLYSQGQVEHPKFVGWGQMPQDKLEQAVATARLEAGEPQATAGRQAEEAKLGTEVARGQRQLLFGGTPREKETILGMRGPKPAFGEERLGLAEQELALSKQASERGEKEYQLALKREQRAEDLHELNKERIRTNIEYLKALTARAAQDPESVGDPQKALDKFNDDIKDALGGATKFKKGTAKALGAGSIIENKPEYQAAVKEAFQRRGLDQWFDLSFEDVRKGGWFGDWGAANYIRVVVKPKVARTKEETTPKPSSIAESWMEKIPVK